jgi:hypothetical protein
MDDGEAVLGAGASKLWDHLSRTLFSTIDDGFLTSFRAPGGANGRLAAWEPVDHTMRYFKFLLFNASRAQPDRFFDLYRRLGVVDLGAPVSVSVRSCAVNIDYFLAVDEFLFLDGAIDLSDVRSIVEIGAGFGRTCHTLLTLLPSVERYMIVDLTNVLSLSRAYLTRVAPEVIDKIHFVDAADGAAWRQSPADLAINIDSFQAMPHTTIAAYLHDLVAACRRFYIKNPIGKYRPASVGITVDDPAKFHDVFSLGYCRDIVDIFDDAALATARRAYIEAYRPDSSSRLIADKPLDIFPYLHHALYAKAGA